MKKLSVLLLAAAVAMGAAAGNKIVNPKTTKINKKEAKELALTKLTHKRGDSMKLKFNSLNDFTSVQHTKLASIKDDGAIIWDFEDADQAAQWTIIDNDHDGYNWMYFNNAGLENGRMTTHSGEGLMTSASFDNETGSVLTPDNWLISPQVTLSGKVGFYAMGQDANYAAEVFAIYLALGTPSGIDDFVKISPDYTATGAYRLYECDLSAYEGMEGCIAIRHYNVSDMFMLNIDDVMIGNYEAEPEPEMPTVITSIPEGCEVYTYYRNSACLYQTFDWSTFSYVWTGGLTDGKVNVAFDPTSDKVYIQNPLWQYANGVWVEGTIDDGIISVPTGQYLTWNDSYGYGIRLLWGYTYVYEDVDGYYLGQEVDERATEIQFMIDGNNLYLLGSEGNIYAEFPDNFNAMGMVAQWSDEDDLECIEFCNVDEQGNTLPFGMIANIVPAIPADPIVTEWVDYGDEDGYNSLRFTLPTTDINGNAIDPEYLSYSVWIDKGNGPEIFTFDYDTYYYDIYEDMTEIPYEIYSNGYDFYSSMVYFYRTFEGAFVNGEPVPGIDPLFTHNIGLQVFYTVDGVKNASNIVWLYDPNTSVEEINAGKTVSNVRYFNLMGQEMQQADGVTIMVTTYTDGTTSAVKVVK